MSKLNILTPRRLFLGLALAVATLELVARPDARAQSPQRPTFSGGVELVNVAVTVRDKDGRLVNDLTQDDFSLEEDGRPQALSFFSKENDLPLTIGLLVDTTPSESKMLDVERGASLSFLSRMLRPDKDKAFLVQYFSEIELVQGLTSNRSQLEDALERLEAHGDSGGGHGVRGGGRPEAGRHGGPGAGQGGLETALADAVFSSSREIMQLQTGRKALLILGDGDHVGGQLPRAVAAAQSAETVVYPIRIYDKNTGSRGGPEGGGVRLPGGITVGGAPGGFGGGGRGGAAPMGGSPPGAGRVPEGENGKENLKQLAKQTGGAYFEVGKKETLGDIYGKIEEELRSQYTIGYTPDAKAVDGFRTIKVSVKKKGMNVRAREGYYARK